MLPTGAPCRRPSTSSVAPTPSTPSAASATVAGQIPHSACLRLHHRVPLARRLTSLHCQAAMVAHLHRRLSSTLAHAPQPCLSPVPLAVFRARRPFPCLLPLLPHGRPPMDVIASPLPSSSWPLMAAMPSSSSLHHQRKSKPSESIARLSSSIKPASPPLPSFLWSMAKPSTFFSTVGYAPFPPLFFSTNVDTPTSPASPSTSSACHPPLPSSPPITMQAMTQSGSSIKLRANLAIQEI